MSRYQERMLDSIKEKAESAKLDKIEQEASEAIRTHNRAAMEKLLKEHQSESGNLALDAIRDELAILDDIEREASVAVDNVDRELMQKVVRDAEEFNVTGGKIDECKKILSYPEIELVKLELEAARKQNDEIRTIHREIRLRDLTIELNGSEYSPITKCTILRNGENLEWQSINLSAPTVNFASIITEDGVPYSIERDEQLKELAFDSFRLIRVYMGDLNDEVAQIEPDEAAMQFLMLGFDEPDILPELYLQVIKQLTGCSNESRERGFELLGFLCTTFGIPEPFDLWVIKWIKEQFEHEKQKLKRFLASINIGQYGVASQKTIPTLRSEFYSRTESRYSIKPGQLTGPTSPEDLAKFKAQIDGENQRLTTNDPNSFDEMDAD